MRALVIGLLMNLMAAGAYAHDPVIHRAISHNAVLNSVLNKASTLERLGLKGVSVDSPDQLFLNFPYDSRQPSNGNYPTSEYFPVTDLVEFGADYEDARRSFQAIHHFFNPLNGRPLTVAPGQTSPGETSPDWALEDKQDYGSSQPFSYRKARQYFYAALTTPDREEQNKNWGKVFQTLGHVIHHVQDMTQPQHTRNDPHCDATFPCRYPGGLVGLYSPSSYENWNLQHRPRTDIYDSYGKVDELAFNTPRKFWTTTNGNGVSGKGIAEFTNRGFFSAGTLPPKSSFPSPVFAPEFSQLDLDIATLCDEEKARGGPPCPPGLKGKMSFFGNNVTDNLKTQASRENKRALTASIFDADLALKKAAPVLSLNRFNFEAVNQFLLPRASSYSSGLIDYFFRGLIDLTPDPVENGKYVISNLSNEPMKGRFSLYYDDIDDVRRPIYLDLTWGDVEIAAHDKKGGFGFTIPTDPAPKRFGEYMLVFKGDMGEETTGNGNMGAVVAKKIGGNGLLLGIGRFYGRGPYYSYLSPDLGQSWIRSGSFVGNGNVSYIGNNSVLAPYALSTDGGRNWSTIGVQNQSIFQKRINVAEVGNQRLIGSDVSPSVYPPEVGVAFSTDNGVTWSADKKADGLLFNVAKPVYMGNNRIVMQSFFLRGQIPCPQSPGLLCDQQGAALFSSTDGGTSWGRVSDLGNLGLNHITYLGKTKLVDGVPRADANGSDTLIAHTYDVVSSRTYRPKLVRSMDGGVTWEETGFPEEMRNYGEPEYNDLWHLTSEGNGTLIAYFHNGNFDARHFLYKSTDNGVTWSSTGTMPVEVLDPGFYSLIFVGDTKATSEVR